MGFLNTDSMPRLVEKLSDGDNIKITGNSKGNRVGTVVKKIVEKADDVTKAIEQEVINDSYSFKVGTGNVDVSADVEDGFGEVGVKGVTYQNLYPQLNTKNYYDKYGGIQFDRDIIKFTANGSYQNIFLKKEALIVKPNTTYTLIIDILKNTIVNEQDDSMLLFLETSKESNQLSYFNETIRLNKNDGIGRYEFVVTTKSDFSVSSYATRCFLNIRATSGELWIKYCILEGDRTNNNNLPSHFEGIVGVGDKSKNLLNINTENHAHGVDFKFEKNVLKSSGIGSVSILQSFKITGLTIGKTYTISCNSNDVGVNSNGTILSLTPTTYRSFVFNDTESIYFQIRQNVDCTKEIKFLLEEGETSTSYEPYYDGHKIEILSCGKNLINLKDMPLGRLENSGKVVMSPTSDSKVTPNFIKIEPTRKVCFYYEYDENDTSTPNHNMIAYYDKNFSYIGATYDWSTKGIVTIPPTEAHYLRLRVRKEAIKLSLIFESSVIYEPYIEDKTQILLDEPLMRLPNGVCDEITRDGKLIRRIRKIVFTGDETESWIKKNNYGDVTRFDIELADIKPMGDIFSDTFVKGDISSPDKEFINIHGFSKLLQIQIKTSKITSDSVSGFKEWLSRNYVTAYYELETPIITELSAPYLRIFKDGHLTFNTLVAPESTHVVQLNKSAQIERSIREVQSLDSRVGKLESFYDDMMLETNHKLSLLNYDFEYTRERNGE